MQEPLLTIAIPTFNRAAKLKRLLNILREETTACHLQSRVTVLVSDNASSDQTPAVASEFMGTDFNFAYHRQPRNLGFDGNLRFLYTQVSSRYIWFLADDDIPLKGAIAKLVNALDEFDPDVLLFSFIQPPGSTYKRFDFPQPVHVIMDPAIAIEHIFRSSKMSIFVLRKIVFDPAQWHELDKNLGDGWYFVTLAFSVLEASSNMRFAVISELLATCDEDFMKLTWVPTAILRSHKPAQHPFVLKYHPDLVGYYYVEGYYQAIQFAFAAKTGGLIPMYPHEYDKFIKELEFRGLTLVRRPRSLLQFITLKLGIASAWPKIRSALNRAHTLFVS